MLLGSKSKLIKTQEGQSIYNSISDIYKGQNHSNIAEFLKVMNNTKNVIYTFSSIFEAIKIPREGVKNEEINVVFKEEDIDNSIFIGSLTSEFELEKAIENFYSSKKQICLLRFRPIHCDKLDEVRIFVDNYQIQRELQKKEIEDDEEEYRNKNKKGYFIFLVENTRIFKVEKEKELEEMRKNSLYKRTLISHLFNFTQIFIDDINGKK